MNRAQKNAWFGLGFSLIADFLVGIIFYVSCTFPKLPVVFGGCCIAFLIFVVLLLCSSIFRRRRSGDIDADERDRQIGLLAIKASFASVWLFLLLANIFIILNIGILGDFPPIMYIFVHLGTFLASATVYFLSILVLYRQPGRIL